MTGSPNERPDDETPPGERHDPQQQETEPSQSPRAAQGPMSGDVTEVPDRGPDRPSEGKKPGMPDATGPTG